MVQTLWHQDSATQETYFQDDNLIVYPMLVQAKGNADNK